MTLCIEALISREGGDFSMLGLGMPGADVDALLG